MHECFCTHWNNENLAMLTFSVGVIKCRSFLAALFSPYSGTKFMLVMLHRLMSTEHMWKSNNLGKKGGEIFRSGAWVFVAAKEVDQRG